MPPLTGLDVYEGQGTINWPLVPDLIFVCAKATQWRDDRFFRRNWDAMRERNFPVRGAYHFNTTEPARVQADRFKRLVGGLLPGEVPCIDYETDLPRIPTLSRQAALDLRDAVEQVFQRESMPYIGYTYPNAKEIIGGRPWWFPSYGISEAGARSQALRLGIVPHVWQWGGGTHGADVPGVTPGARDDSNYVLLPQDLISWAHGSASPPSTPDLPFPSPQNDNTGPRSRPMFTITNGAGAKEKFSLHANGGIYNTWETFPGNGQFGPWNHTVEGAFQDLGTSALVNEHGAVLFDAVGHPDYGSIPFTLLQAGPGQPFTAHVTNDLNAFFASLKG